MKKNILVLFLFFFSLSCDTVEEEFLYDEGDDEYAELLTLEAQECIDGATIFDALESAGDFENSGQLNKIYKVAQDDNDAVTLYIKITAVSATEMTLVVNSIDTKYQKILNFEKTDHDALITLLKTVSCNSTYEDFFTARNLDDNDTMTLTWEKETIETQDSDDDTDEDPEGYKRQTDVYTIDNDLPLIFFFYNGTKTTNILLDDGDVETDEETEKASALTVTDVTNEDECEEGNSSQNNGCRFEADDITDFADCDVNVDDDVFNNNIFGSEFISLSSTNSFTCTLLESGD